MFRKDVKNPKRCKVNLDKNLGQQKIAARNGKTKTSTTITS